MDLLEIMNIILHVSCGQKFLVSLSSGFHKGNPVECKEREVTVVDTIFFRYNGINCGGP